MLVCTFVVRTTDYAFVVIIIIVIIIMIIIITFLK